MENTTNKLIDQGIQRSDQEDKENNLIDQTKAENVQSRIENIAIKRLN